MEICRICLESGELKPIFTTNCLSQVQMSCAEAIMKLTSITALENDGLPTNICKRCLTKLKSAYKFKLLCEDSYIKLAGQNGLLIERNVDNILQETINDCDIIQTEEKILEITNEVIEEIKNKDNFEDFESRAQSDCENDFKNESESNSNLENVIIPEIIIDNSKRKLKCKRIKKLRKKIRENKDEIICNKDKETNNEQLLFQCCKCEKSFDNINRLKKHEQGHLSIKGYFCDICQKTFGSSTHRATHEPLRCALCPRVFLRARALKAHELRHQGVLPFQCVHPGCNKAFPINSRLQLHLKVHTDERNFICQYCSHAARDKQQLNTHIRYYHTKEKNYPCGSCGKAFVSPQARYYHAKRHENIRNHHCPHCDKSFVFAFGLQEHLVTHTGEKRFPCSICEAKFSRKAHREKHEASVHAINRPPSRRPPILSSIKAQTQAA